MSRLMAITRAGLKRCPLKIKNQLFGKQGEACWRGVLLVGIIPAMKEEIEIGYRPFADFVDEKELPWLKIPHRDLSCPAEYCDSTPFSFYNLIDLGIHMNNVHEYTPLEISEYLKRWEPRE